MKCIYCETNETNGVLLCYGCQVDLFPLVSAWAYCGACGRELPAESTTCAECKLSANTVVVASNPASAATKTKAVAAQQSQTEEPTEELPATPSPTPPSPPTRRAGSLKEPFASPTDIDRARRFQFRIKFIFALLWLVLVILALWWARHLVNQPLSPIIP